MARMKPPRGAVGLLLIAVAIGACGASQPSSAVEDDTSAPTQAAATASPEPSASAETPSAEVTNPPATPGTAKAIPPKPGKPTFKKVDEVPGDTEGTFKQTFRITWTAPKGVADSFPVYGLPYCLRESKKYNDTPCVVRGMKIPADDLVLLGVAPGDDRSIDVSWEIGEVDVPPYWTILMRATNAKGDSIFTIVKSYDVCFKCTY
jgi:hypothetical protein